MENSTFFPSKQDAAASEESGWTAYIDDDAAPEESGWTAHIDDVAAPEESGWTAYISDVMELEEKGKMTRTDCSSATVENADRLSFAVSDAASSAPVWRKEVEEASTESALPLLLKKLRPLRFNKKRRVKGCYDEDELDDTACSPGCSPKVMGTDNFQSHNDIRVNYGAYTSQDGIGYNASHLELRRNENDIGGYMKTINGCSELRKKGFCLVPLSTVVGLTFENK